MPATAAASAVPAVAGMGPDLELRSGYRGFLAFSEGLGEPLAPFLRRIARAYFGPAREVAAILPRGNYKTSLAALIGLHHLLTVPGAEVTIGAASKDQARICFERMRGFCAHPALEAVTVRHLELRAPEELSGLLRVVPSDGPRAHGLSSSLFILDELWAHRDAELLEAAQTGLIKRSDSTLLVISTAAAKLDSPLGRMRTRALSQAEVKRKGAVIEAKGDLHWLEWSLPDEDSLDDMRAVKRANPAPWIAVADLRRQRAAVQEVAFAQFHANRWGVQEGAWLPAGAWQACAAEDAEIEDGEAVWAGVDIGGSRAASSVVLVTEDLRVKARVWQGDDAVLKVADYVAELAGRYSIREVAYDPWRFRSEALRLEEAGLPMVEFPQTNVRMVPASERLYAAIVEQRLKHPNDPELNSHVAQAIARQTPRGWRIDKAKESDQVDALIALVMAIDRATQPKRTAQFLGWI